MPTDASSSSVAKEIVRIGQLMLRDDVPAQ
jgi:hypothetical protein